MNTSTNLDQIEISIIIPIYFNRLELYQVIDRCIKSVKEHYPTAELILVDDASPIEVDWDISIKKDINTGYTNTVNQGLRAATRDILVVMNDDITLKTGDLDRFYKISSVGIYSPKTTDEGAGDYFGSLWGMNKETYKIMGDLDENYPHYFSDTKYYERAKKLGVPIIKWEDIVVEHIGKATYKTIGM